MKYYAPENASFLLPFQFDKELLKSDYEKCLQFEFLDNYIPANYNGQKYILPLRSIDGRVDIPVSAPNAANQYENTEILAECPYFQEVINTFKCEKEAVRLMSLPPGAIMNTHTDLYCGYEDGVFRIHVPIVTNDDVMFILNDKVLQMKAGEVWYTNVNLPHSVKNLGNTKRVHLVIDCIRNEWSDVLFGQLGFDFSQERNVKEVLSGNVVLRMIEELELNDSPEAKIFLEKLKKEHDIQ